MTGSDDAFERMMRGALGADAESMEAMFSGTIVEPLYPGRLELLEHFEVFEQQFRMAKTDEQREHCCAKLFTMLARIEELDVSMPMQLTGVRSYITGPSSHSLQYGLFENTATATGTFVGFNIESWYNVPEGHPMPDDEDYTYFEEYGLFLCLEDAQMTSPDIDVEYTGMITQIPLQHGSPELFRLHLSQ